MYSKCIHMPPDGHTCETRALGRRRDVRFAVCGGTIHLCMYDLCMYVARLPRCYMRASPLQTAGSYRLIDPGRATGLLYTPSLCPDTLGQPGSGAKCGRAHDWMGGRWWWLRSIKPRVRDLLALRYHTSTGQALETLTSDRFATTSRKSRPTAPSLIGAGRGPRSPPAWQAWLW